MGAVLGYKLFFLHAWVEPAHRVDVIKIMIISLQDHILSIVSSDKLVILFTYNSASL